MSITYVPAIPSVPPGQGRELTAFLNALKQSIENIKGSNDIDSSVITGSTVAGVTTVTGIAVNQSSFSNPTITNGTFSSITITSGKLQPDNSFLIDITNKNVLFAASNGYQIDDFIVINNGRIASYEWNGSTHDLQAPVTRIESGVTTDGTTVTIPGTWKDQPLVTVTLGTMMSYDTGSSGSDQSIFLAAENMTQYEDDKWRFDAVARLQLDAYAGITVVNWSSGASSANSHETGQYTTPANCTNIVVHMLLTSVRGTGIAPGRYLRTGSLTLYYRVALSGDPWTSGATGSFPLGKTVKPVKASLSLSVSAGTYEFYVAVAYSDYGGQFDVGAGAYQSNSVTPSNDLGFTHYSYQLTSHSVLDQGTLIWTAIG